MSPISNHKMHSNADQKYFDLVDKVFTKRLLRTEPKEPQVEQRSEVKNIFDLSEKKEFDPTIRRPTPKHVNPVQVDEEDTQITSEYLNDFLMLSDFDPVFWSRKLRAAKQAKMEREIQIQINALISIQKVVDYETLIQHPPPNYSAPTPSAVRPVKNDIVFDWAMFTQPPPEIPMSDIGIRCAQFVLDENEMVSESESTEIEKPSDISTIENSDCDVSLPKAVKSILRTDKLEETDLNKKKVKINRLVEKLHIASKVVKKDNIHGRKAQHKRYKATETHPLPNKPSTEVLRKLNLNAKERKIEKRGEWIEVCSNKRTCKRLGSN